MSSNTNIGNTPVNQGYVQLIHTGETGGIDGTLRTLYDGDGTASDLQIASNKVKVSTELYIGSKTATEFIQDIVGDMFTTGSYTNITTTYDDTNGNIDLNATGAVSGITGGTGIDATGSGNITIAIDSTVTTLTGTQTLTNKTLTAPTLTGTTQGASITLSGDLTVNGTTTTVNQTNLDVSDNIIGLNRGASSNANDSGLIIERGSTGDNVFIGWDESADRVVFGVTSATPDSTGNLTIVNQPIQAARLYGDVSGNVTGSASLNLLISSNLSDLANAATARTNLGVAIGSDVQAYDAGLQSISGLTTSANKMIYTTASDTYATTTLSAVGRSLIDDNTVVDMRTTLGLGLLATRDTVDFDRIDGSAYIASNESFSDSDLQLMTAAAIDDLIVSKGYGTGNGDITAVNAGVGIGGGATSGDVDLTFEGSELPDMTDLMGPTDEFVVLDGTTSKRKAISEIRLTAFDDTGFSSGISFNGSTANGLLTYGNSTTADVESNLTFDASSNLNLLSDSGKLRIGAGNDLELYHDGTNDYIDSGGTAMFFRQGTTEKIKFNSAGNIQFNNAQADINTRFGTTGSTNTLFIDGGTNRVGIGTNSPVGKLMVREDVAGSPAKIIVSNNGTVQSGTTSRLSFYEGTSEKSYIERRRDGTGQTAFVTPADDNPFVWENATGEFMRFTGSNVGIGTSSPNRLLHLQSNGDTIMQITSADGSGAFIDLGDVSDVDGGRIVYDSGSNLLFNTASTERLRIDSSGNVLIGGTSASGHGFNLEVLNDHAYVQGPDGWNGAGDLAIVALGSSVANENFGCGYKYGTGLILSIYKSGGNGSFGSSSYDALTILDTSGNVGIGTTSPTAKLEVNSSDGTETLRLHKSDTTITENEIIGEMLFTTADTTLNSDRKVIGAIKCFAEENFSGANANEGSLQFFTANATDLRNSAAPTPRMVIDENGFVGIGTTTPDTTLDITSTGANGIVLNQQSSDSNTSSRLFFKQDDTTWNVYGSGGALQFNSGATVGSSSGTLKFQMKADGFRILDGALGVDVQPSTTDGRIDAGNDVVAFSTSDKRLKENIKPLDSALDKVLKINGVSFDWKELTEEEKKTIHGNEGHDVGVIAQEIEEVLPEVVTTRDSGYKAVKYEKIVPLLIEAIKEQQQQIEELKNG